MSLFSNDADLLAYEPRVFLELPLPMQGGLRVTDGAVSGAVLTSAAGGFSVLSAGDVIVLRSTDADAMTCAVHAVTDDHTVVLTMSPHGLPATGLIVEQRTLKPQALRVHEELMRSIGIDPDDAEEEMDESAVISVSLMRRLECLSTLALAYGGAAALAGDNAVVGEKAESYRRRFRAAANGARVLLDLDGDGRADVWRTPGVGRLVRA